MITEPVWGRGLWSGGSYLMGEAGPEEITPIGRRGGSGGVYFAPGSIVIQGMDFSNPHTIEDITRKVSDKIAANLRVMTGAGRAF